MLRVLKNIPLILTLVAVVYFWTGWAPQIKPNKAPAPPCGEKIEIAALGIVGCNVGDGFRVTTARRNPAGVIAGDVITEIDGVSVQDAREIEIMMAANVTGTVRIGYRMQGKWLAYGEARP